MHAAVTPSATPGERLGRGELPRLAYRLGRSHATGVLTLHPSGCGPEVLVLKRGHVMTVEQDVLGRQLGWRLARLASMAEVQYEFAGGPVASQSEHQRRSVCLAAWARAHLEAQLDTHLARSMAAELAGARLILVPHNAPEPSMCDAADLRILTAMRAPRRLEQLWSLARTSRYKLMAFLHFLRCVGAVQLIGVAVPPPDRPPRLLARHLLGVSADADRETLKRAYRRLARALHPDLHQNASAARRRLLERKLAAITAAYQQLTGG